jgi:hypothetical protein
MLNKRDWTAQLHSGVAALAKFPTTRPHARRFVTARDRKDTGQPVCWRLSLLPVAWHTRVALEVRDSKDRGTKSAQGKLLWCERSGLDEPSIMWSVSVCLSWSHATHKYDT